MAIERDNPPAADNQQETLQIPSHAAPRILSIEGALRDDARLHRILAEIYGGTAIGAGHALKARDSLDRADDLE